MEWEETRVTTQHTQKSYLLHLYSHWIGCATASFISIILKGIIIKSTIKTLCLKTSLQILSFASLFKQWLLLIMYVCFLDGSPGNSSFAALVVLSFYMSLKELGNFYNLVKYPVGLSLVLCFLSHRKVFFNKTSFNK